MAPLNRRALDIRWIKKPRYRKFVVIGSLIFTINVFLVHILVNSYRDPSSEEEDPSGRGRYQIDGGSPPEEDDPNSDTHFQLERRRHIEAEKALLKRRNAIIGSKAFVNSNKLSQNAISTGSSLKLAELDFVPECNLTTREAISAVNRARTQECKKLIVNVTCAVQKETLYPSYLPSNCPAPGVTRGKSLGCYQDDMSLRLLSGYFTNLEQANSPENCINLCLQSGFPYAGVEYWTECFCGVEPPPSSAKLPASSCNTKCPSDAMQTCGGYLTINIYETGIVKFIPQVANTVTSDDVVSVRIAYLLTLSGRALRQIKRLIRALYHKDHYFFIHVDARQDYLFRELVYLERVLPNVKLMRKRHGTMWAGSSLLKMLLEAMQQMLELPWQWNLVLNLSESDFPVKTNEKLVAFLQANKDKNFVKSTGRDIQRFIHKQGLDKTFVECDGHMWRVGDRILPKGIQMDGGSDWLALSRPFVEYVTSETRDELLTGLDQIYRYTLLPAESYFHTVLRNSHFCNTYVDNNLHLTNWKRHLGCKCQYKHIVDWCGCSPNDFTLDDWSKITGTTSSNLFFARKFEAIINQGVINKLEEWVYSTSPTTVNLLSYWQSVYHHADLTPPRDDSLLSLCTSLARLARAQLRRSQALNQWITEDNDIIELTTYHYDDVFQGLLVRYNFSSNYSASNNIQLESWYKFKSHFQILDPTNGKFIQKLYVSADFDVKEQTSRSLQGALGPFSDLSMVYVVEPNIATNLTFLFVDPAGQLAQVIDVYISDKSSGKEHIGSSKILLPHPMLPGIWEVFVYHTGFHVAHLLYLVIPLRSLAGAHLTVKQAMLMHGGGAEYRIGADKLHWTSALEENTSKHSLMLANAKRTGSDLDLWIDGLVSQFYDAVDSCHMNGTIAGLEPCVSTIWSSVAPDPKSSITGYDPENEKIR